ANALDESWPSSSPRGRLHLSADQQRRSDWGSGIQYAGIGRYRTVGQVGYPAGRTIPADRPALERGDAPPDPRPDHRAGPSPSRIRRGGGEPARPDPRARAVRRPWPALDPRRRKASLTKGDSGVYSKFAYCRLLSRPIW